jgi:hypothetical protein
MLKKSGKTYELRSAASETTEGYAMLEGGCTDGTYSYFVLINKDNSKGRILKSRRSDNATVAVSKVMVLDHANDMTYNEKTGELLVVHYNNSPYRITVIDLETMTIDENVDVEIPDELEGASENNLDNIKGFSAIGYSSARNQYVLRLKKSYNYLILDSNFTPVKYVTTTVRGENVNQGIDADDDYIYDVQSKSGYYNTVMVYDWDGEYQATVKVPSKYEMENLYHVGNKFYAGVYRYYYTTYYTTHYKTYKVKWKKVKGKWKYKTKYKTKTKKVRVTYKVAHKRLVREDYVYSIGTI